VAWRSLALTPRPASRNWKFKARKASFDSDPEQVRRLGIACKKDEIKTKPHDWLFRHSAEDEWARVAAEGRN
jgi:hypothetical protein